jgi:hypothetical protein
VTFAYALAAGSALVCCGVFAASWRRGSTSLLVALPPLTGGAAVCLAGVSRFAAAGPDAETGQELAVLVSVVGLAAVILGVAAARGRAVR